MRKRFGIKLNQKQIEKLSDFAMDLAKAQFLAAIALPFVINSFQDIGKFYLSGIILMSYSLWIIRAKEEK